MNTDLMFSSVRTDWETPFDLFNKLNEEFHFTLDVCATENNKKCENYFSPEQNGLIQNWSGVCWMNPPYGKEISSWVEKAYNENIMERTDRIVALLPARTDTQYFHKFIYNIAEIRFLKGRIKFVGAKYSAPFPSMICIW
jgi:site-specific DNA-methyltransferase (adenine-specific)